MLKKSIESDVRSLSLKSTEKSGKGLQALTRPWKSNSNQRKQLRVWGEKEAQEKDFPGTTGPGSGMHGGLLLLLSTLPCNTVWGTKLYLN